MPKGQKESRFHIFQKQDPDHGALDLPPIEAGDYLIGYLQELGYTRSSGMGPCPLDYSEVKAWQEVTHTPLNHWEALAIRRLSSEFVGALHSAEDPNAPSPYLGDIEKRRQETTDFFKALARQRQ